MIRVGDRFTVKDGEIEVIAYDTQKNMRVMFIESGEKVYCSYQQIQRGGLKDPSKHNLWKT